jgi:von Willebrand factor type A domain
MTNTRRQSFRRGAGSRRNRFRSEGPEMLEDRVLLFSNVFALPDGFEPIHEEITENALYFLKPSVIQDILGESSILGIPTPRVDLNDTNGVLFKGNVGVDIDSVLRGTTPFMSSDPSHHFDGDAFAEGSDFINLDYQTFLNELALPSPFADDELASQFGRALHTAQDFYAHTNWVNYIAAGWIAGGTIVDDGTGYWAPMLPYSDVAPGVVLVEQDGRTSQAAQSVQSLSYVGGPSFEVDVSFSDGSTAKGLISGNYEPGAILGIHLFSEPNFSPPNIDVPHDDEPNRPGLNKDTRDRLRYNLAYDLAVQQTRHEFVRLFNLIENDSRYGADYAHELLCAWVEPDMLADAERLLGLPVSGPAIVAVIDHSGSMADENKLIDAQAAADQFVGLLDDGNQLGIVQFDDTAQAVFPLTTLDADSSARDDATQAIDGIELGGGTSIGAGLDAAYDQLEESESPLGAIVLLTDVTVHGPASVRAWTVDMRVSSLWYGLM